MVGLALIGSTAAVPKEQPLQALVALEFVGEPKLVLLVSHLQKVEQFGRCLHDGEWWRLIVVHNDRNTAFPRNGN